MSFRAALIVVALAAGGCAPRAPIQSSTPRNLPVNAQAVAAKWQYPGSTVVSGGSTSGLYHAALTSDRTYEEVWMFYARRIGYAGALRPDAREVGSDCSSKPEGCVGHGLETLDSDGIRAASFAYRSTEGGVVILVSRPDSAKLTRIQLTVTAP